MPGRLHIAIAIAMAGMLLAGCREAKQTDGGAARDGGADHVAAVMPPAEAQCPTPMAATPPKDGLSFVPADPQEESKAGGTAYTVTAGDSFYSISGKVYGSGQHYALIQKANPDVKCGALQAGQVLRIPPCPAPTPGAAAPLAKPIRDDRDIHVVASGESLWSIAQRYYGNGALSGRIKEANGLHGDSLKVGQRLRIPPKPQPAGAASSTPAVPEGYKQYVVKSGDTLLSIAQATLGESRNWSLITEANPAARNGVLRPGQVLLIPPSLPYCAVTPGGVAGGR